MINNYRDYETYLRSPEWKEKSHAAKERAGWRCALDFNGKDLDVHHRTYARLGHEDPDDLIVLCHRCHQRHHGTFDECAEQLALFLDYMESPPDDDENP
jgi:5-methylcytosine-specific restriction endonuclease McrA